MLITGRDGQLARSLAEKASDAPELQLVFAHRPEFDLADEGSIRRTIDNVRPDVIVNVAAYTAVDQAEDEPELAERINAHGPRLLAESARETGARLIQVSTDYVFDGTSDTPYAEDAATNPLGVYGRTKLAGERAVCEARPQHLILRTAWVYSPFGRNFVKTMLALARDRDRLTVVEDQIGNPSSALDLAEGLLTVIQSWRDSDPQGVGQTLHLAGSGSASWAELAREVLRVSREHGGPFAEVVGIATSEWPTKARRPANSRLDSSRFEALFGYQTPAWQASVAHVVPRILAQA